jgi:hypothetical protein
MSSACLDKEHFQAFCSLLTIPGKEGDEETGEQLVPLLFHACQHYVVDKIVEGQKKGIRFFVILKCRQSGITTLGLALDLYLCFKHDGYVHNFIGDISKVTSYNRSLCRDFVQSLAKYPEWAQRIVDDNSDQIKFGNRSQINWHIANARNEGGLGRSIGAVAAHGTELSRWKDEEGTGSLMSSLAEHNPNRFFMWESTAAGAGIFQDMCKEAGGDGNTSQEFIFVPWWMHPWYESRMDLPEGRNQFNVYWESNKTLTREEVVWVDGVKKQFGFEIRPTQLSWWRWHLKEKKFGNLELMYQEYPPLVSYAWRYGARSFISSSKIVERETIILERREVAKRFYRFEFGRGSEFNDCRPVEVDPDKSFYDLITWDDPDPNAPGVRYAIGCDPSHGADEKSDDASVQVVRCFADQCVQVAEFCRNEIPAYQLAWVVLHLAGTYNAGPHFCTELQGGGYELHNEVKRLQMNQAWGYSKVLERAFSEISFYIWTRADARKGLGNSHHYRMGGDSKSWMMESLRHYFERGMLDIRSRPLVEEMRGVSWTKEGDLEIPRPNHRLMAFGLAVMAYKQVLDTDIGGSEFTRINWEKKKREASGAQTQEEYLGTLLTNWRDRLIMDQKDRELIEKRDDLSDRPVRHYR